MHALGHACSQKAGEWVVQDVYNEPGQVTWSYSPRCARKRLACVEVSEGFRAPRRA